MLALRIVAVLTLMISASVGTRVTAALPQNVAAAWNGSARCLAPAMLDDAALHAALAAAPEKTAAALRELVGKVPASARDCADPGCVADRVFGPRTGRLLLLMLLRHGYNGSHVTKPGAAPWQPDLLDNVLAALGDFGAPRRSQVRALVADARIDRFRGDLAITDTSAVLLALSSARRTVGIRVGETWAALPPDYRRAALFHELVHDAVRDREGDGEWRQHWLRMADADAYFARLRRSASGPVSHYARASIDEDVAESATAYRYMPDMLKAHSPNRYRMLRDWLFGGREFLPGAPCA
jgi:hypothetical protein